MGIRQSEWVLRCPRCLRSLARWRERRETFTCAQCSAPVGVDATAIDFAMDRQRPVGWGARAMQSAWLAGIYDRWWRPALFGLSTGFGAPSARDEARRAVDLLKDCEGAWLDVSCGSGTLTRELVAAAGAREVVGLDLSRAMLERARASAPEALLVRADAGDLPFDDAVFGGVANMAALDLYSDPERVVRESARVVRPGGRWVASTFVTPGRSSVASLDALEKWAGRAGLGRLGRVSFRGYLIAWADKE